MLVRHVTFRKCLKKVDAEGGVSLRTRPGRKDVHPFDSSSIGEEAGGTLRRVKDGLIIANPKDFPDGIQHLKIANRKEDFHTGIQRLTIANQKEDLHPGIQRLKIGNRKEDLHTGIQDQAQLITFKLLRTASVV